MLKTNTNSAFDEVALSSEGITAFQTTRLSPSNKLSPHSVYGQFNLGLHVGDNEKQVLANRCELESYLPIGTNIQWLEQVHGNTVAQINAHNKQPVIADAVVTSSKRLALAVMTADCLPILLKSKHNNEIAAIHGGWRPLSANIIAKTVAKMATKPSELEAWLGPSIGAAIFEVGHEVKAEFLTLERQLSKYFQASDTGKYLADLPGIAQHLLKLAGVCHISINSPCTMLNNQRYYSYRRENVTGRMASIIAIN